MEYLYDINNYVGWEILGKRLHFKEFWGEIPDISMTRFKFWEPVYYRNWTDKSCKFLMHPGRFMGLSWNIGYPMTFKVLQCNENPHKWDVVVHRGVVFPCSQTATGYNSALAPKSDAYFPVVKVEGGVTNKTVPLEHQVTVDPPYIFIPEGGGNRRKPSSLSPKSVESDRSTAGSNEPVVDGPGTVDGFPALDN